MRWTFTWGQQYQNMLEMHQDPSEVPFVKNAPTLTDVEAFYAEAFMTLSNSRDSGFGLGPLKISEIAAYLSIFPTWDTEAFVMLMQLMDEEFMEVQVSKNEQRKTKHSR